LWSCSPRSRPPVARPYDVRSIRRALAEFRRDAAQIARSPIRPPHRAGCGHFGRSWIFSSPVIGGDGPSRSLRGPRLYRSGGMPRAGACARARSSTRRALDDRGRVYFAAETGACTHATPAPARVWTYAAARVVHRAFINWFEGNVGIQRDGTLTRRTTIALRLDRSTGARRSTQNARPDLALPAVDAARGTLGRQQYSRGTERSASPPTRRRWMAEVTAVVASPLLTATRCRGGGSTGSCASMPPTAARAGFPDSSHITPARPRFPTARSSWHRRTGVYALDPPQRRVSHDERAAGSGRAGVDVSRVGTSSASGRGAS